MSRMGTPTSRTMMAKLKNSKMRAAVSASRLKVLAVHLTMGPSSRKTLFCSSWDLGAAALDCSEAAADVVASGAVCCAWRRRGATAGRAKSSEQNTRPDTKEPGTRRLKIGRRRLAGWRALLINIGNFMSGNPRRPLAVRRGRPGRPTRRWSQGWSVLPRRLRYQARPWPGSL